MLHMKFINNKPVKIEDPSTMLTDPAILEIKENIPPFIKGRQELSNFELDYSTFPPEANYTIKDVPINTRKLNLISQVEFMKDKNMITLETAFQRIDQITNCITHDDLDVYEQSLI
jgi:hypothetical protein